jgi:hypothetical protein
MVRKERMAAPVRRKEIMTAPVIELGTKEIMTAPVIEWRREP